ncbi:hypothetical protein [Anabaena sp. CCY 0017]|uniref:hypothetical protein n=1 Tax=Anabaena sp. CCY 0017 TaxID=3103866 RepID=UPI0039C5D9EA
MGTKDALEIIIAFFTFVGFVWRIARMEAAIYKDIDRVKDGVEKQLYLIDKRLDLHIQDSIASRDSFTYRLDGQGSRLGGEIENLKKRASGIIVFERLESKLDEFLEKHK